MVLTKIQKHQNVFLICSLTINSLTEGKKALEYIINLLVAADTIALDVTSL